MKKSRIVLLFLTTLVGVLLFSTTKLRAAPNIITSVEGAQIRVAKGDKQQGLKFTCELDPSYKDNEFGFYLVYGYVDLEVFKTALRLSGEDITFNGKAVFKTQVPNLNLQNQFSVVLTGIPERGYLDSLNAVGYVIVDGETIFTDKIYSRSVFSVAKKLRQQNYQNDAVDEILNCACNLNRLTKQGDNYFVQKGVFETDYKRLKSLFITDWKTKTGLTWNGDAHQFFEQASAPLVNDNEGNRGNKNISTTNLYKFFTDQKYLDKWDWFLDYLIEVDGTIHPTRQIKAIRNNGVADGSDGFSNPDALFNLEHLSYAISNFFNNIKSHGEYYPNTLEFTQAKYNELKNFNMTINTDLTNFVLYCKTGDIISASNLYPRGYKAVSYTTNGQNYDVNEPITISGDGQLIKLDLKPISYNVEFYDGDIILDQYSTTYNIETGLTLPIVNIEGFDFNGWYNNKTLNGEPVLKINEGVIGDKKFYLNIDVSKFTVTYKNHLNDNVEVFRVEYDQKVPHIPEVPKRDGYTGSWETDLNNVNIKENKIVLSKYVPINYTITYNLNGGIQNNNNVSNYNIEQEVKFASPTKENYYFKGWYKTSNFSDPQLKTIPKGTFGDLVLYAKWDEIPPIEYYSINYELNGGSFSGYTDRNKMVEDFLIDFYNFLGQPGGNLNAFIHGDDNFNGFYNNTEHIDRLYMPNNKGVDAGTGMFINQPSYNKWVSLLNLVDSFAKVNPDQSFWGSKFEGAARMKQFFRKDNVHKKEHDYVNNLFETIPAGLSANVYHEYNSESLDILLPTPHRNTYVFEGWYTNSNFTGNKVTKIEANERGNKKFYAKWSQKIYHVHFHLDGGWHGLFKDRNTLADAFLHDLYSFIRPAGVSLHDFMHRYGLFDGDWYHNEDFRYQIYKAHTRRDNNDYFASAMIYSDKWGPIFSMMERFVRDVNPDQDFWSDPYVGTMRLWQYLRNVKPSSYVSNATMNMSPTTIWPTRYFGGSQRIILHEAVKEGYVFDGWWTEDFPGNPPFRVDHIAAGAHHDLNYYARWRRVEIPTGDKIVAFAKTKVGGPYVWGGNGPRGYDCSGLTMAAYAHVGINIPRVANDQYRSSRKINFDQLRPGDLVFWRDNSGHVYHVAIWLGNNRILHAANSNDGIIEGNMYGHSSALYGTYW